VRHVAALSHDFQSRVWDSIDERARIRHRHDGVVFTVYDEYFDTTLNDSLNGVLFLVVGSLVVAIATRGGERGAENFRRRIRCGDGC